MQYRVDTIALKKRMVEQGLERITDLSKASSVDRNTLSKVLNGNVKPSTTVIEKLMVALNISPDLAGKIFFDQKLT